ncbi:hypothetical protein ONZ45_g4153 [Pleurotus djamor]|nr:hypothetical protein ONZ45_g4153 [Pleurotus djamor]
MYFSLSLWRPQRIPSNSGRLLQKTIPPLAIKQCFPGSNCQTVQKSVVLDASWRWTHLTSGYTNCYEGNDWSPICANNPVGCAQLCAIDGADYAGEFGVTTHATSINLKFVTPHPWGYNVGSRVFLLADSTNYEMFKLANREFSFEVDLVDMPCGVKASIYFVDMQQDGGISSFPNNKAGAQYGTGYCDSQCPRNIKWIDGEANSVNWIPYSDSKGKGHYGSCCREVDLFHGNGHAHLWSAHPCPSDTPQRCVGEFDCGDRPDYTLNSACDKDGCAFNAYRLGNPTFFGPGPGHTIDTTLPFTVTTQFITEDGTDDSIVVEIRRYYKQFGVVIPAPSTSITPPPSSGMSTFGPFDSITDQYCHDVKQVFDEPDVWDGAGGLQHTVIPQGPDVGKVLVMSIDDDYDRHLDWLETDPHGPCPSGSGDPGEVELVSPTAQVRFSDLRFGPIGSTN